MASESLLYVDYDFIPWNIILYFMFLDIQDNYEKETVEQQEIKKYNANADGMWKW